MVGGRRPTLPKVYVTVRPTVKEPRSTPVPPKTVVEYPPLVKPDTVKAQCGESSVLVEVDLDLLGIGHLIQPSDITLGGCAPVGQGNSAQALLFETELQGCGSTLTMTEDSLVYTFALHYQPKALGATPIIRTNGAVVGIKCLYMRLHNVSSNALKPTWIPYRSTLSGEDLLVFTLRLMTDNWMQERVSNMFFLGDIMNIEASVVQANHVLLRVFVDTCVATLDPNMDAVPRYAFIENQGCLMDSKLTSSRSQFLPTVEDDKLRFQLDAFRFAQESRSSIYIVCHLKATAVSPDTEGKACSFSPGSERSVSCDGDSGVFGFPVNMAAQWQGDAALGPIIVQQVSANDMIQSQSVPLKAEAHRATVRPTVKEPRSTPVPPKTVVEYPPLVKPDTVRAQCGESSVLVEVDLDLLGIGHLIQPSDITLGGCAPVGQGNSVQALLFETELQGCGSTLTMTEGSLVYTFALHYQPKALGATPIIRTNGAVVGIKCLYMRLHNVSSSALKPTWIPYRSTLSGEDLLVFTLRLMTDDWMQERVSNMFFLGDIMNIEASVVQANHVLLRVFVDTCVATLDPNMDAVPRYAFIENQGCLMDSKLTSSRSMFLPTIEDDKLRFQLDAFRFAQESRSSIYIVCHLKATAVSPDTEGKACSFSPGSERWTDAHGNDQACGCCDTSCTGRKGRSLADSAAQWQGDAALGPIIVQQASANDMMSQSQSVPLKAEAHSATGVSPEAVVMAGVVAAVGLVCVVVLGTVLLWRLHKPTL
ncbi:hypothetical protein AAFF_G00274450 [Aldrovandia affinis]|uniref:Zona pellucida sperm-binding protein 3 n=1 Tax=Aldrovandia affinis TaxID=143900 RepID=A0AAD7SS24_9TELE|nr:hypothetical protein AAFF_G00274450 [Aldrovandia affinis]